MKEDINNHLQSGLEHFRAGDFKRALQEFQCAQQLSPHSRDVYLLAASAEFALGNLDGALRHYEEVVRIAPDAAEPYLGIAAIHHERGESLQEVKALEAAAATPDNSPARQTALGYLAVQKKEFARARDHFAYATELYSSPERSQALIALGQTLLMIGEMDQARSVLTEATTLPCYSNRLQSDAYYHRGVANYRLGDTAATRADWLAALEHDFRHPHAFSELIALELRERRWAAAWQHLLRMLRRAGSERQK